MIIVNNTPLEHKDGMTVADVLKARNYIFRMLAVSVNGEFVPRKAYGTTPVPDGADVQVIHMISGGSGEVPLLLQGSRSQESGGPARRFP